MVIAIDGLRIDERNLRVWGESGDSTWALTMQRRAVNSVGNYGAASQMNTHKLLVSDSGPPAISASAYFRPGTNRGSHQAVSGDTQGSSQGASRQLPKALHPEMQPLLSVLRTTLMRLRQHLPLSPDNEDELRAAGSHAQTWYRAPTESTGQGASQTTLYATPSPRCLVKAAGRFTPSTSISTVGAAILTIVSAAGPKLRPCTPAHAKAGSLPVSGRGVVSPWKPLPRSGQARA